MHRFNNSDGTDKQTITVAGNVAFVRISSWFSKLTTFNDMFTLAEQDGKWKIVSKIYNVK